MLELKFDKDVWQIFFTKIKDLFDKEGIEVPKRKVCYRDEYCEILKKYLERNTRLIAEVPSVECDITGMDAFETEGPYRLPNHITKGRSSSFSVVA